MDSDWDEQIKLQDEEWRKAGQAVIEKWGSGSRRAIEDAINSLSRPQFNAQMYSWDLFCSKKELEAEKRDMVNKLKTVEAKTEQESNVEKKEKRQHQKELASAKDCIRRLQRKLVQLAEQKSELKKEKKMLQLEKRKMVEEWGKLEDAINEQIGKLEECMGSLEDEESAAMMIDTIGPFVSVVPRNNNVFEMSLEEDRLKEGLYKRFCETQRPS